MMSCARHGWIDALNENAINSKVDKVFLRFLQSKSIPPVESPAQLISSIYSELTELLWMELALLDKADFYYISDSIDGDHFGIKNFDLDYTATEFLASPGYEATRWLNFSYEVDGGAAIDEIENHMGLEEFLMKPDHILYITALQYGESNGHLKITEKFDVNEIFENLTDVTDYQYENTELIVHPDKKEIEKFLSENEYSYSKMDEAIKSYLVDNLIDTLNHPFLGEYGISKHILRVMQIHPDTPSKILTKIETSLK